MTKLTRITVLDHTQRPRAPKIEGITPRQRRQGRRLALFHDMHREQMQHVEDVLAGIERGEQNASALGTALSDMPMAANYRMFGNLCGQECLMLSGHHGIEDAHVFPTLHDAGSDGLRRVIERLAAEHLVVHELIAELEVQAEALARSPTAAGFAQVKATFATLNQVVRSHFGYEETELEEALGVIDIGL
jgi:iron-sulfur cluster repair protein YtfE (RIC family)